MLEGGGGYNLSETIFMDCCNFIAVMWLHRVYSYAI